MPRCLWACVWLLAVAAVGGCKSFVVRPIEEVGFLDRVHVDSDENVRVRVAVLSADESKRAFGVPLARKGIQPVWVEVENRTEMPYWLWLVALDQDYFSPIESAYLFKGGFLQRDQDRLFDHFHASGFPNPVAPGQTTSGYVFTNLDLGIKNVNIDLLTSGDRKQFSFIVDVPGLEVAHSVEQLETIYTDDAFMHCEDLECLREALEALPACTTNKKGTEEGDPINFFLIGTRFEIFPPFVRQNWHQTEAITSKTVLKTISSSIFGHRYRYSPISPLYYLGRPQDLGAQKARGTVDERSHLRLWLTPIKYQGASVWAGAISRDIGVKLTLKSSTLSTHVIDPDLDEARLYLIQDLLQAESVSALGYVKGGRASSLADPSDNLTDDIYISDGLRAVLFFSEEPTMAWEIELVDWEMPSRTREALGW